MATNTYVALDKVTVTSAVPSITFNNISQIYTDLVVVVSMIAASTTAKYAEVQVGNGSVDTGNNYSDTGLYGNGSSAGTFRDTNSNVFYLNAASTDLVSTTEPFTAILNFQNYSNTTTYKTVLIRTNMASTKILADVGLWRSTSAINTITFLTSTTNYGVGSTFSLYGIKSEGALAKATGGIITSDATYMYHTFLTSGTFTPTQSLTCDYLVVAGGGGGGQGYVDGGNAGGGGGGGGLRSTVSATGGGGSLETALSLSATGYTVTVGAGGASNTAGSDSVFSSITSAGGGKGGYNSNNSIAVGNRGGAGGSGGGGGYLLNLGGAGTTNQGYAGGSGQDGGGYGGGGGGAGQAGNTGGQGKGGNGVQTAISGTATYYAGGGSAAYNGQTGGLGGGGNGAANGAAVGGAGTANTGGGGGGGGGTYSAGGAGGSGVVIVRYLKA